MGTFHKNPNPTHTCHSKGKMHSRIRPCVANSSKTCTNTDGFGFLTPSDLGQNLLASNLNAFFVSSTWIANIACANARGLTQTSVVRNEEEEWLSFIVDVVSDDMRSIDLDGDVVDSVSEIELLS